MPLVQPFFFGSTKTRLFGCHHVPTSDAARGCAIVFCDPVGHEYIRTHRAFRLLADRCAHIGFPVLRFNYYGCGDSSGASEEGSVHQWMTDVSTAIDEMKRRCGLTELCLVGSRLGGALAMMAGAERGDVRAMVLWDPVVNGNAYVKQLAAWHRKMLLYAHVKDSPRSSGVRAEALGFALPDTLVSGLERIDLLNVREKPASNVLLIETKSQMTDGRLREHLLNMNARVTHQSYSIADMWLWFENVGNVLAPAEILRSIVHWITETC
jgi:pimeloyl-ACP methyl ester carboxylesterase